MRGGEAWVADLEFPQGESESIECASELRSNAVQVTCAGAQAMELLLAMRIRCRRLTSFFIRRRLESFGMVPAKRLKRPGAKLLAPR